jgi:hypothetical protein
MPKNKWVWVVCSVFIVALFLPALAGAAAPKPDYLWWKFDEGSGTVAKDSSGNSRDGTITAATWVTPGAGGLGSCLNFTGGSATVVNAAAGTGLNGKGAVTFSMWVKSRVINTDKGFLICETPAGNDTYCDMRYDAAGSNGGGTNVLKMSVNSTSGAQALESSNGLQTTEWHHVAMTWQGGVGVKFYSNGKLNTPTNVQAVNTGTIAGNTTLIIGQGGKDNSGGAGGWDGYIDDVRVYTYALTDTQVADLLSFTSADASSIPSPAMNATNVPRDTTLSWMAAETAQTHTVYLGTDFADVNNATAAKPLNVLVSAGQTDATFTSVSPLQYGKVYYWRVDETSATGTVTKGDVWSFTVEPYAYPIKNITATASSSQANAGPQNTVNGSGLNSADQHSTELKDMWLSAGTQPNWIQFAFDKAYNLSEMWVWNSNQLIEAFIGFGAKNVQVEYSLDGSTWTQLQDVPQFAQGTGSATYTANTMVNLGGVSAKFVKLTILSQWGMVPQASLSEVRFFYVPVQAMAPRPATQATGVALATTLTWRPGREAASHKVYLGTDPNAVANGAVAAQTVTDTSFSPAGLLYGTTYYWKVDEVNTATYPGDVWSFTTTAFGVVDDFESYNDDDNRIYDTWIDGLTDGKSGSQVGYDAAPFAEKTIVHSGKQSMPLKYDNTAKSFSEAVQTFSPAQNWTANGVKSLSLWFQGAAGNGGQLYVKINGAKVSYNGSATDIARPTWIPWSIDLSAVSGGVTKVTSLTIGIEGSGAKGILYVDDIRLYPTPAAAPKVWIITNAVRTKGQSGTRTDGSPINGVYTGETAPVFPPFDGLRDGNFCYSDRPYPWSLTPASMVGSEYVLTYNQDKTAGEKDVAYTVTFAKAVTIWVAVDDRPWTDGTTVMTGQMAVDRIVAAFAKPGQFKDTGVDIYVHENDTTDRPMSVFSADMPAGTYVFGSNDNNGDFYVIGAMAK